MAACVVAASAYLCPLYAQGQIALSWPLSTASPAASAFEAGRYDLARSLTTAHLAAVQARGATSATEQLDLARTMYGTGGNNDADVVVSQLLAQSPQSDADLLIRGAALYLRAELGISSKDILQRAQDLEAALKIHTRLSGPASAQALRIQASLAILLVSHAPALAAEPLAKLKAIYESGKLEHGRDAIWIAISWGQALNQIGANASAEAVLTDAVAASAKLVGAKHPDTLYAKHQLAFALRRQGKGESALAALKSLYPELKAVRGGDHPQTLKTAVLLSRQLSDANLFSEALEVATTVEAATARVNGEGSAQHLSTQSEVASILAAMGRPQAALDLQQKVFNRLSSVAPSGDAFKTAKFSLASLYAANGKLTLAEELFRQINIEDQKEYPPGHPLRWPTINNLATLYGNGRDPQKELALLNELDDELSKSVAAADRSLVSVRSNWAAALLAAGRIDDAMQQLNKIIAALAPPVRPANDPQLMRARAQLASALSAAGKQTEAIKQHRAILDIRLRDLPPQHPDIASTWHALGYALDSDKQFSAAMDAYLAGFEIRKVALGLDHPSTLLSARAAAGLAATDLNDPSRAIALYSEALQGAELIRSRGPTGDWLRQSDFKQITNQYKLHARVLAKAGRWADAFGVIDLSKARTLRESTYRQIHVMAGKLTSAELAELTRLERELADANSRVALAGRDSAESRAQAVVNANAASDTEKLRTLRDDSAKRVGLFREKLSKRYGWADINNELTTHPQTDKDQLTSDAIFLNMSMLGDAMLVVALEPNGAVTGGVSTKRIPGLLSSLTALRTIIAQPKGLDFFATGDERIGPSALWKLPTGGFKLMDLSTPAPPGATEEESIDGLVAYVSESIGNLIPAQAWNYRRLIISPDDELAMIPFDMLLHSDEMLVKRHEIVYTQSWSMYKLLKKRAALYRSLTRKQMLVFGDPLYEIATAMPATTRGYSSPGSESPSKDVPFTHLKWHNLPGASQEAQRIAKLYKLNSGENLFTGASASEETLARMDNSGELARYQMLLFATHGYLDGRIADRSSVVLTQLPKELLKGDGYVTAAEWKGMRLHSDLVFLSACETGLGEIVPGEGIVGLPLSLFAAGNQNTIMTLWPIYDESSSEFVGRFFANVKAGDDYPTALTKTKRDFSEGRVRETWRNPAFWSPFVLYGH